MKIRLDETTNGVRERVGTIVGTSGTIPLAIWTPNDATPSRLILVGHGASGTKHESYVVALARALVRSDSCAVVSIDGPVHGERREDDNGDLVMPFLDFAKLWSSDDGLTDAMVVDWRETLDQLFEHSVVTSDAKVGYWGLSMGTILGLPFVASEPRIVTCVLGLMGATGPTRERLVRDAQHITIPTMFLLQWDDELFARSDVLELFDQLGAADKTLLASPGAHAAVTNENFQRTAEFLVDRLSKAAAVAN